MFPRRAAAAALALRPRQPARILRYRSQIGVSSRRWASNDSAEVGEKSSGHISVSADNESILFFDNLFPLKIGYFLRRPWQSDDDMARRFEATTMGTSDPIGLIKRAIPADAQVKVIDIIPRIKDGGAFIKFQHPAEVSSESIEEKLSKSLEDKPLKPWFNPFRNIRVGLVNGIPWLEDLNRFPKSRVKIEFIPKEPGAEAVELSQETLYSLFRRYGKLSEITSQPFDSKTFPRYAHIDFSLVRDAILARNCMHGFVVNEALGGGKMGTKLRMSYEQRVKPHSIWNWLTSHPRVVIPIVAALLATITVAIFDPIRKFFIKAHVEHAFRLSDNAVVNWFRIRTSNMLSSFGRQRQTASSLGALWKQRGDLLDQLQTWLLESSETFIIVQGPRGSGKKELVLEQALKDRKNVLVIDCKPIVEAGSESATIKHLAAAVGYRPVFSWANNLSSLIDLAVQSTTGVKAGFSETLDTQLAKIFHTAASALKTVSLSSRDKNSESRDEVSDDSFLEAHPENRAVVVINNFLHKHEDPSIVYEAISNWAADLVQNNIAHVIFLTTDSGYSKTLSRALPDRVFHQISLGDLSPDVAKKFILSRLEEDRRTADAAKESSSSAENTSTEPTEKEPPIPPELELDDCIHTLGGRLADLEFLIRRIRTGQSPHQAVHDIISQTAAETVKIFLLASPDPERKWSREQAWHLISHLANHESLPYNELLLSPTFSSSATPSAKDGAAALEALAALELVSITTARGHPTAVLASRPLCRAAYATITADTMLRAQMDLAVLRELAGVETKTIRDAESELAVLGALPKQPSQTAGRISYLLGKIEGSQRKIEGMEREMVVLKRVLTKGE